MRKGNEKTIQSLFARREYSFIQQFVGIPYDEASATYLEASPINHMDKDDPPVLLIQGSVDGSVSVEDSDALAMKLMEVEVPHTYDPVEDRSYAKDIFSPIGERTPMQPNNSLERTGNAAVKVRVNGDQGDKSAM